MIRTLVLMAALIASAAPSPSGALDTSAPPAGSRTQMRPHATRIVVDRSRIRVMDGDTMEIRWSRVDVETVRVLGVDTAELFARNGGSRPTARGAEARGFARGAFAVASRVELLRARSLDRYRRTLGYFFIDGRNYSVLLVQSGLARETVSRFGDNGFAREAREVLEAARGRPRPAG